VAERAIGWREVFLVAAAAVLCVLAVAALAIFVPAVGDVFRATPLTVIFIVVATVLVLWRIAVRPRPGP
jgi:hypothetical protein